MDLGVETGSGVSGSGIVTPIDVAEPEKKKDSRRLSRSWQMMEWKEESKVNSWLANPITQRSGASYR